MFCRIPFLTTIGLKCESNPLTVTWEPKAAKITAPASLVKDVEYEVTCELEDLGNPPAEIQLYVLGNKDLNGTQEGPKATMRYKETNFVNGIEFVCRTRATELVQVEFFFSCGHATLYLYDALSIRRSIGLLVHPSINHTRVGKCDAVVVTVCV